MSPIQLNISVDNSLKEKCYKYISKKQVEESIFYIIDKIEKFINKDFLFRSLCGFIHVEVVQLFILDDNAYSIGLKFEDSENPRVGVFLEGMEKLSDEKQKLIMEMISIFLKGNLIQI